MISYIEEAGAIVIRNGAAGPKILLILSKKKPPMRIFPKGHIEPGETATDAAQRELREEAGIDGHLLGEAGTVTYQFQEKWFRVAYFYFSYKRQASSGEPGRDPRWFTFTAAAAEMEFEHLRMLIRPDVFEEYLRHS